MTLPPITATPLASQYPSAPRPMFSSLAIASSGLTAQRVRLDVIAQNLANAETTSTAQGGPYQRRVVQLQAIQALDSTVATPILPAPGYSPTAAAGTATDSTGATTPASAAAAASAAATQALATATGVSTDDADVAGGVRVAGIGIDTSAGPMVYNPGSPDADKNGYVRMPNVNMTDEMVDLMNTRRVYEANATVFQVARAMLHKAIDI
ncbi:MAG TPA: flagellar basal body rod protein FlgC [Gemmatimonadaceae bacterium]|jgi:flagellar basal-body rod protein FlgC